ncbi:MAG: DUF6318 family protein [Cellulomonas sp.]|nr:DUF6318 family protein [Cellulomonas sp.]
MGRTRWGAVVVAGVAVGLSGCSSAEVVAPTASASASPVGGLPSPMASPTKPPEWTDNSAAGANAAALWFVRDAYAYVRETNDAADWQALSTPDCEFCAGVAAEAVTQAAAGQVGREGSWQVAVTRTQELNPLAFSVLVDFDKPGTEVLRSDGSLVAMTEGSHGQVLLVLRREGPNWLLRAGQWFEDGTTVPTTAP